MITYKSTRGDKQRYTFLETVLKGIADDGGLFIPERIPSLTSAELHLLINTSYQKTAQLIFEKFETGIPAKMLQQMIGEAYGDNFDTEDIVPVVHLEKNHYMLELWHGPTSAFKDMALQIMPLFFEYAVNQERNPKKYLILVGTSGDTGKASLEGFKNRKGIGIAVFYPDNRVSHLQKLQMVTQEEKNVAVYAMDGDFDDVQRSIKNVFADSEFNNELLNRYNTVLSSANSINWGRLMPQIVYYVYSYMQLIRQGLITLGQETDIAVPSGNFGNILAALYAKKMGLPFPKLICASNTNNVLTDFLLTGIYDISERRLYTTSSPSMDILIASNIERLLFLLTNDTDQVTKWMIELKRNKKFSVDKQTKELLNELFYADWIPNETCLDTIKSVFDRTGYLMDTHTAVCQEVASRYTQNIGNDVPLLVCSTAHFAKFPRDVYKALTGSEKVQDEFELLEKIHKLANRVEIPENLLSLRQKRILHTKQCKAGKEAVEEIILQICQLGKVIL